MFGFKKLKKLLQKREDETNQAQLDTFDFSWEEVKRAISKMSDEELEKALAAVNKKIAELEEK